MPNLGRQLLLGTLVATLAALAVVHPALSFAHGLEHLEHAGATSPPEEAPLGDSESGGLCDLCVSLSQGRTPLVSKAMAPPVRTPLVGRTESVVPLLVPIRASRAPQSPRAPPHG